MSSHNSDKPPVSERQLARQYRREAREKSPESVDAAVLNCARKKAEQLTTAKAAAGTGSFRGLAQSHWLGFASACCALLLMTALLVPLTRAPKLSAPVVEAKKVPALPIQAAAPESVTALESASEQSISMSAPQPTALAAPAESARSTAFARAVPSRKAAPTEHAREQVALDLAAQADADTVADNSPPDVLQQALIDEIEQLLKRDKRQLAEQKIAEFKQLYPNFSAPEHWPKKASQTHEKH